MRYIIYRIVSPSHLAEISEEGYYVKKIERSILQKIDVSGVTSEHQTFEAALAEIHENRLELKYMQLTILPIIEIGFDGEFYQ